MGETQSKGFDARGPRGNLDARREHILTDKRTNNPTVAKKHALQEEQDVLEEEEIRRQRLEKGFIITFCIPIALTLL